VRKLFNESGAIHTLQLLLIVAAVGIISFLLISSTAPLGGLFGTTNPKTASHAATSGDRKSTFDNPNPNPAGANTRSGELDGIVWGASRSTSDDNQGQGSYFTWHASQMNHCGTTTTVGPELDLQICNGQLMEAVNDGGGNVTSFAQYPKQPFDFAGRTGIVSFDVGDDTQGSHMAWPEFVLTDLPVPAPGDQHAGINDFAANSFGVSMAEDCRNGQAINPQTGDFGDSWSVDKFFTTKDSQWQTTAPPLLGCVKKPTAFGQVNHVEIRISQNHQEVWATDPGSTTLKEIAAANLNLTLTRGLAWMEDIHYNACKDPGTQCDHTFVWDNFGFDGPILPRDLTFDVLDANHSGNKTGSIGYFLPAGGKLTLQVPGVTGIANATKAFVLLTWRTNAPDTVSVALNGHATHDQPWAFGTAGDQADASETTAIPVPLNEIVSGINSVAFTASNQISVANVDILLVGAGGIPSCINPSQCAGSPTLKPSPTPPASATPKPSSTPAASGCPKLALGDANCSGNIDLLDYSIVISHFGQTVTSGTNGDVNSNGSVDLLDYSVTISHFGQ
jgi:hypothetical protein